jgi:hypothetical protein
MSKERAKRYKDKHPEAWQDFRSRIGFGATIRLYSDKPTDSALIASLEAQRAEGESDRDLLLRLLQKVSNQARS